LQETTHKSKQTSISQTDNRFKSINGLEQSRVLQKTKNSIVVSKKQS